MSSKVAKDAARLIANSIQCSIFDGYGTVENEVRLCNCLKEAIIKAEVDILLGNKSKHAIDVLNYL